MALHASFGLVSTLVALASARDVPQSVRNFYNAVRQGQCGDPLATGFTSTWDGTDDTVYCGDTRNVIYLQGPSRNLTNMDVCCDGEQGGPADDGRCNNDPSLLSITAFQSEIEDYDVGIKDLNANVHSYIVFGNTGDTPGWPTFLPEDHGIEPLSLMAVVCGENLFYGVWGDMNGDDGDAAMVGEASISLATACYGREDINADSGYDINDVLYLAFPGQDAVPGASGADWAAENFDDFEASLADLGNRLIKRLDSNGSSDSTNESDDQSDDGPSDAAPGSADMKLALSIGPIVLFSSFLIQMFPA